jgi:N-acetylglutamate synthase-like GNAT family acetyltransferase
VNGQTYQVRRATTDDLRQLAEMWRAAQLPVAELEKRFTEFQVAASSTGEVAAAIGLQVSRADGKIHSEWFTDFALSDSLRPALWERLQAVAFNHGIYRLWTEESAPYWKKDAGFSVPTPELAARLPEDFGAARAGWLVLRLKDEAADPDLLEAQFAVFREAEQARREKLLRRAHAIKMIGTGLAVIIFVMALLTLVWFISHRR